MKLAIVGGGYVGSAVARLWHQSGHEVTVTTTTPEKVSQLEEIASRVIILSGNDLDRLKQVVTNQDAVLLCVGSKQRTIDVYRQAYWETAQNLLTALQACPGIKQLIYTSSYGIINDTSGDVIDETVQVRPRDEFGEVLHQTEQAIAAVPASDFQTCIFRLTGIYGPGRELIKIFRRMAGTTRPGRGAGYTNWVHLEDIARAIDFAVQQQLHGIYHLSSDEYLTTREFFDRLFAAHDLDPLKWDTSQPESRPYSMKVSNQKLKNAGFELLHPQLEFI